ncbi:FixH family protein [Pseudidiomarina terrestris]|uniref:FixH family protein n=1 Tax=Pseudidiomarina terrestris TaxID=2820060 RepID=UPI00264CFC9C|nr:MULTISPECIES: FixH family protein [unclassified Pseudidiomarina]MDN7135142.1 FixH family protein [Pseudidiomarina sp. 1ASP75-5]MDN7137813.1 FixH family protein [Pseudidiomarina sp. 1ASP75-14]
MVKPWYKQVWPWVLMSIPFSVVIAMAITLTVASRYDNPMVIDDYYKQGRGINTQVGKVQEAQARGITFSFSHEGTNLVLSYASGQPDELTALRINFYHTTLADKDFSLRLTADAEGRFRGQLPADVATERGKWTVTVTPFDGSWRLSQQVFLPSPREITLEPLTYGV